MMDFDHFVEYLVGNYHKGLPGEDAQSVMSPLGRPSIKRALEGYSGLVKESAVLLCIHPMADSYGFTLMERNSYNGHHSRQISLPGGKKEEHDQSLSETALREFQEEMGVELNHVDLVGALTPVFIPPSGFYVEPYLAYSKTELNYNPDKTEVSSLIHVDFWEFINEVPIESSYFSSGNGSYTIKAPSFIISNHKVWGATAMILAEFKSLCKRFV